MKSGLFWKIWDFETNFVAKNYLCWWQIVSHYWTFFIISPSLSILWIWETIKKQDLYMSIAKSFGIFRAWCPYHGGLPPENIMKCLSSRYYCMTHESFTKAPQWTPNVIVKNIIWLISLKLVRRDHKIIRNLVSNGFFGKEEWPLLLVIQWFSRISSFLCYSCSFMKFHSFIL